MHVLLCFYFTKNCNEAIQFHLVTSSVPKTIHKWLREIRVEQTELSREKTLHRDFNTDVYLHFSNVSSCYWEQEGCSKAKQPLCYSRLCQDAKAGNTQWRMVSETSLYWRLQELFSKGIKTSTKFKTSPQKKMQNNNPKTRSQRFAW